MLEINVGEDLKCDFEDEFVKDSLVVIYGESG
jgi:hypothetical protein